LEIRKTAKGRKEKLLKTYLGNPVPSKALAWSPEEELEELKTAATQFKDTALSIALKQSANAVKANVQQLDDSAANELMQALNSRQQSRTYELPGGERGGLM